MPAGAPAVIAFTLVQVLLLFFCCCVFPWFASLVPGLSLFPGPCFFPDRDFLQDVTGYAFSPQIRTLVWDADTARRVYLGLSPRVMWRNVRDCTHLENRTTFFYILFFPRARAQECVGWSFNRYVYPGEPWDAYHATQLVRVSPQHAIVGMLMDTTPLKKTTLLKPFSPIRL